MLDRFLNSIARQFKVIFPNTLNAHETLFGGTAMQWMDEVAYIQNSCFSTFTALQAKIQRPHLQQVNSGVEFQLAPCLSENPEF